jgi:putative NADH-flavin reductase
MTQRLFIIGATGHTGTQLIDLALARGHNVTAFARSPSKIARRHERLTVAPGDPLSTDELARALPGHDVVLSALGMRPPGAFRPHTLVQAGAASTVAAMTRAGVPRLVLVSAAVLFPLRGLRYAFFRALLKHIARDLGAAEDIVRATGLEWTIARPPRLVSRASENYRSARDALPAHARAMSFRAVAAFMLDAVEERRYVHEIVGLAS